MANTVINLSGKTFTYGGFTYFPTVDELKHVNVAEDKLKQHYPSHSIGREIPTKVTYTTLSEKLLKERAYIDDDVLFVYRDEYTASIMKPYIRERFNCPVAYEKGGELCEL